MVVPRKWKIVAGTMSAAMALGAGGALAEEADSETEDAPLLVDVVKAEELPAVAELDTSEILAQNQDEDALESPFDALADETEVSDESEESEETEQSEESEESVSEESVSEASEESID